MISTRAKIDPTDRNGQAQIELILGLPLLLTLLSIPFGICSIVENRTSVAMNARNSAFEYRNDRDQANPAELPLTQATQLGLLRTSPRGLSPKAGLLDGKAESHARNLWGPIKALPLKSKRHVFLYSGTWDYREIEFKDQPAHHPLAFDPMLKKFWPDVNTNDFSKLSGFGSIRGSVPNLSAIQNGFQRLRTDYREQEMQIRNELARLRIQPQTEAVARKVDQLNRNMAQLQSGKNILRELGTKLDLSTGDGNSGFTEEQDESLDGIVNRWLSSMKPASSSERAMQRFALLQHAYQQNAHLLRRIDSALSFLGIADLVHDALAKVGKNVVKGDYARAAREAGKLIAGLAFNSYAAPILGRIATSAAVAAGLNPVGVVVFTAAVAIGANAGLDVGFDAILDSILPSTTRR